MIVISIKLKTKYLQTPMYRAGEVQNLTKQGVLLLLQDKEGNIGAGDAFPLPGYSPDTIEEVRKAFETLKSRVPFKVEENAEGVAAFLKELSALKKLPSAVFALETALFFLICKRKKISISSLLGRGTHEKVHLNALIPLNEEPSNIEKLKEKGIRAFKIKVGDSDYSSEDELKKLLKIRQIIGAESKLRLDANGGFDPKEAKQRLLGYSLVCPEFVEEPVSFKNWFLLEPGKVPLAIDESGFDIEVFKQVVLRADCAAVVIKPSLQGGLINSFKRAKEAQKLGKGVVITHMFEGVISFIACLQLAFALEKQPLFCGLYAHDCLGEWKIFFEDQAMGGSYKRDSFENISFILEQIVTKDD